MTNTEHLYPTTKFTSYDILFQLDDQTIDDMIVKTIPHDIEDDLHCNTTGSTSVQELHFKYTEDDEDGGEENRLCDLAIGLYLGEIDCHNSYGRRVNTVHLRIDNLIQKRNEVKEKLQRLGLQFDDNNIRLLFISNNCMCCS